MDQKRLFAAIAISIGILLLFDLYNRPAREAQQVRQQQVEAAGQQAPRPGPDRSAPHADRRRPCRRRAAHARRRGCPWKGRACRVRSRSAARASTIWCCATTARPPSRTRPWCGCWRRAKAARPTTRSGAGRRRMAAPPFPATTPTGRPRAAGSRPARRSPCAGTTGRGRSSRSPCRSTRTSWSPPSSACATTPPSRFPCCPGCGCGASARRPPRAGRCCTRASPACSTGACNEVTYSAAKDEAAKRAGIAFEQESAGGWAGFTDKYWLTALAPVDQSGARPRHLPRHAGSRPARPRRIVGRWTSRRRGAIAGAGRRHRRRPGGAPLRRRQGGEPARRLWRPVRHPGLRQGGGFRLVLLPDQALLPRAALDRAAGGQLRRRHPDLHLPAQARLLPAGEQGLQVDEPDEDLRAEDAGDPGTV